MLSEIEKFDKMLVCVKGIYHNYRLYDYRSIYPVKVLRTEYSGIEPNTKGYFNLMWYGKFNIWIIIAFVPMR